MSNWMAAVMLVSGITTAVSAAPAADTAQSEKWREAEVDSHNAVVPKHAKVQPKVASAGAKNAAPATPKVKLPPFKPFATLDKDFATNATLGRLAAKTVAERLKYDPLMFPYYTGTILPVPQQVSYSDAFAPIADVGVVLGKGLKPDDVRVAVILKRISLYGGNAKVVPVSEAGKHGLTLSIGETGLVKDFAAPDHAEGYAIKTISSKHVAVAYQDKLGLLWAMSSLRQMVTENKMRLVDVVDYPSTACRRILPIRWALDDNGANAFLQAKASEAYFPGSSFMTRGQWWLSKDWPSALTTQTVAKIGATLNPLGITWFGGLQAWDLDCKSEDHSRRLEGFVELLAKNGGNFWFDWDDWRFLSFTDPDKKNFGSRREADVYFVNKVYRAVRAKYPAVKFIYCPPCYWKLAGTKACFKPESDIEYWKAMATRFPKDIAIFWTGNHVFSTCITKEEVERVTGLLGRKPTYWQNRTLPGDHPGMVFYPASPVTYGPKNGNYYKGFLNDLEAYYVNSSTMGANDATGCYLWNPDAYDCDAVAKEVAMRMVGPENYADLKTWCDNLSACDPYYLRAYHGGRVPAPPAAIQHYDEMEAHARQAMEALVRVANARPASMSLGISLAFTYSGAFNLGMIQRLYSDPARFNK